ncbi:MAG TPA: cation diffusion facilitator family transporter [Kofleriaceae bacterium]|nr:cation diffusion facilitator family transporter [Kofleriaceae bacterium]
MAITLVLTVTYLVAEAAASWLTGSLALLADAGHMLTDAGGVGLSLFAMVLAERPATPERTYGYYRAEILATMVNALLLLAISGFVLYEAVRRFQDPPEISSATMMIVAAFGLAINSIGVLLLRAGASESLNVKAAYFEVATDALTSVGVLVAGAIMWTTGWYYADPIVSALIGVLIIPRVWRLLREATGILLEGTPAEVSIAAVREAIQRVPGVAGVHDLHVWSLSSGLNSLSAHVVLAADGGHEEARDAVVRLLTQDFPISHVTVQVESRACAQHGMHE